MAKQYIVNYKIIEYQKLKKVSYNGVLIFPIYLQISFRRQTTLIKSHYFDFFANPLNFLGEPINYPNIEEIISMEQSLLDHVIKKVENTDTLDSVIKKYYYYSRDLCSVLEESFGLTMNLFLRGKKLNYLAKKLITVPGSEVLYFLLKDLSNSLKPEIFKELMSNAFEHKQFYVQLFEYFLQIKKVPYHYLSVKEWDDSNFKDGFKVYLRALELNDEEIIKSINKLIQ